MNPSASGWIKKHLPVFEKEIIEANYSEDQFYQQLKNTGFIYANSISSITYSESSTFPLTLEEISKINLFDALGYVFFNLNPEASTSDFLQQATDFYDFLKKNSWFNFHIPFLKSSTGAKLEKIIDQRVRTNERTIQRNFSSLIANALLYLDVLTFEYFLKTGGDPIHFAKNFEALLANTIFIALQQKSNKSKHEKLVLRLMESSLRYNKIEEISHPFDKLNYSAHQDKTEGLYIFDLACLAVYADEILEHQEEQFIVDLAENLAIYDSNISANIEHVQHFITKNKGKITYLDTSNPFRNLYDNTNRMVRILILRNKKRLIKEIRQSRQLMVLLKKSRSSELSITEKAEVKTQLLDICKMIPSLAIFLLPGGSILLPIFMKFIPELLPSAFDDNR